VVVVCLAALQACDGGDAAQRGFGSTQLVPLRDPTFEFWGSKGDVVYYRTDRDTNGNGDPNYWSIDLGTGQIQDLGGTGPDFTTPQPPARYACEYDAAAEGHQTTYKVTDTQTGELTVIENVYGTLPYCPADADPTLQLWRIEADDTLTLWTGPYTDLVQAPLPLAVHQLFGLSSSSWIVSGASATPPGGLGVYSFPEADPATWTEIVPPALGGAAWATRATPSASPLTSSGLIESSLFLPAGRGRYAYERAMADDSVVMFAGPQTSGPAELALFPVDPAGMLRILNVEEYAYRYQAVTSFIDAWTSIEGSPPTTMFRIWHPKTAQLAACPWAGGDQFPNAFLDPAGENVVLLEPQNGYQLRDNSPFLLVVPAAAAGSQCNLMATDNVGYADFSPDGTAVAWLVEPKGDKATLWTAARDGSAPHALGTDYIDGFNSGQTAPPHFVGASQLELTLQGDLAWLDVHDDPLQLHYITEQVFGPPIDLGRWLVAGHEFSDQDGNGALALINRDTGETRAISPGVVTYRSPDAKAIGYGPAGLTDDGSPLRVVYLVRGRNPSPQDGVWVATITAQDRQ
jgi:hypothetical protein